MAALDPLQAAMVQAARDPSRPQAPDITAEQFRALVAEGRRSIPPGPAIHDVRDVVLGAGDSAFRVRRYRPAPAEPRGTVLFFHSGGWVLGDVDSCDHEVRALAEASGLEYLSVDYRRAPEHPFPAAVEDAAVALGYAASLGRPLIVQGDSAGGNLAAVAARLARDEGVRVLLQVLTYPVVDAACSRASYVERAGAGLLSAAEMRWFLDQYLPVAADRVDPRVDLLAGELPGLAPAHVVVAEYDVLRDEVRDYASALTAAGVRVELREYPDCTHGFAGLPGILPQADRCVLDVAEAIRRAVAVDGGHTFP